MEHPEETYTFFAWGGDPRPDPEPPPEPWVMIISIAASLSTIIQVILMIMEMSKKNKEKKVGKAKQKLDPRDGDTIEEIRVQMSDGTRLHLEVWRANPEKSSSSFRYFIIHRHQSLFTSYFSYEVEPSYESLYRTTQNINASLMKLFNC